MNAIVLNTRMRAVSEYQNFDFFSITQHHVGGVTGLYELVGDTDDGAQIPAVFRTPPLLQDETKKKSIAAMYFAMEGPGDMQLTVHGRESEWDYSFPINARGMSRCLTGRGIRETYLAITVRNLLGSYFQIDRIETTDNKSNKSTRKV